MDIELPFATWFQPTPDMSLEDIQGEIDRLYRRQRAISGLLEGTVDEDYVTDLLMQDGVDPHLWLEVAEDNLEFLLSQ